MTTQPDLFNTPQAAPQPRNMPTFNPDGVSVKGCSFIYAPKGQAGEYAPLAANPYKGCGHKCAYCLSGDTLILMADGSTKTIESIQVGDKIIGIKILGKERAWNTRITTTTVKAKISSRKQAYKITLSDGSTVICSEDHRWLTERGWKYTTGTMAGEGQRPYLTVNNSIRKVGSSTIAPDETDAYRRGYLSGMIRGDGHLAIHGPYERVGFHSERPGNSNHPYRWQHVAYQFRLALKDTQALDRTDRYLHGFGVDTQKFDFGIDTNNPNRSPMKAIRTSSKSSYESILDLISYSHGIEWNRGWLAGIFDSEGSHGKEALRISNTDKKILDTTKAALTLHGFDFAQESSVENPKRATTIRILGGRSETMRFWQVANPSIKRKFKLEGRAVCASVKVLDIEPLGKVIEMFDITTGTGNFIANGLVSHNCYVPAILRMDRATFDAGAIPRPGFLDNLTKDARKYQLLGSDSQVMLSFTTDVFNPSDMSLTRPTIEILKDHGLA
ncbi:MAG TPA: hypothetical protein VFI27_16715, partial [candidate division Zixibacteria bacterium]|nr:hypothetical protein [candidate division Zixibacteria bacterium]